MLMLRHFRNAWSLVNSSLVIAIFLMLFISPLTLSLGVYPRYLNEVTGELRKVLPIWNVPFIILDDVHIMFLRRKLSITYYSVVSFSFSLKISLRSKSIHLSPYYNANNQFHVFFNIFTLQHNVALKIYTLIISSTNVLSKNLHIVLR